MNRFTRSVRVLSFTSVLVASFAALDGCKTGHPGVTNTLGTYSTDVDASLEKTTRAAEKALERMKFLQITSSLTSADGRVTAKTAQGDDICINIEKLGEHASRMSVRVGNTGDAAVSAQIIEKIRRDLD